MAFDAVVFRVFLRQRREVGAGRLRLLQDVFGLLAYGRFVLAFGLEQDVAGAHLFWRLELLDVRVVVTVDVLRRDRHARAHLVAIDEQVPDLPLLALAVFGLVRARSTRTRPASLTLTLSRNLSAVSATTCELHLLIAVLCTRARLRHPPAPSSP